MPGDFSSPEPILADPRVKIAIEAMAGYIPGEAWKRADGAACECGSAFALDCE